LTDQLQREIAQAQGQDAQGAQPGGQQPGQQKGGRGDQRQAGTQPGQNRCGVASRRTMRRRVAKSRASRVRQVSPVDNSPAASKPGQKGWAWSRTREYGSTKQTRWVLAVSNRAKLRAGNPAAAEQAGGQPGEQSGLANSDNQPPGDQKKGRTTGPQWESACRQSWRTKPTRRKIGGGAPTVEDVINGREISEAGMGRAGGGSVEMAASGTAVR